jgi:hypothetical protein
MQCTALSAAAWAVGISLVFPNASLADGREWPDGPNKKWLESLQRPDNEQHPYRKFDPKSLSCCDAGITFKPSSRSRMSAANIPKTFGTLG